jgi:hypothetical protein
VSTASLTLAFIILLLWLINARALLPGIVILGALILFVLWIVGLIITSVELWGPTGSINGNCNLFVNSQSPHGADITTLAWLEQRSICMSWQAAWSFEMVGCVFLLWMCIMAFGVYRDH